MSVNLDSATPTASNQGVTGHLQPATPLVWRGVRRRFLPWLVGLLLMVGLIVANQWIGIQRGPFDPTSAQPLGTRAVAQTLRDQGINVNLVRDSEAVSHAADQAHSSLVIFNTGGQDSPPPLVGPADLAGYHRVILVGFSQMQLPALGFAEVFSSPVGNAAQPDCHDPELGYAQKVTAAQIGYRAQLPWTGCFNATGSAQVLSRPGTASSPRVDLVANQRIFTNDGVLRLDNAALALRVLGRDDRLVWFVPNRPWFWEQPSAASVWTLGRPGMFPNWLPSTINLLVAACVVALLWRGRRLGRLVVEPLPVEVRALETTRDRGQLYRRSGDASHALALLQSASRRRLATRVGLTPGVTISELVTQVARETGEDPGRIEQMLNGPLTLTPQTRDQEDAALLRAAKSLSELEKRLTR